jgi:hypothetical protein
MRIAQSWAAGVGASLLLLSSAASLQAQLTELAYYRLGEDDGNVTAGDMLSETVERIEGRDMQSAGQLIYSSDTPPKINSSLSVAFDGEIDNFLFADAVPWHNFFPGYQVGMEAFLKIDPEIEGLYSVPFGNGTGYFLSIGEDGYYHAHAGEQTFDGITEVKYGEWQHVAFWTTGSFWQIYVDGVPQFEFDALPSFNYGSPSGLATIGADRDGASEYVGLIDEMRVFTWTGPFSPADLLFFSLRNAGDVDENGLVDQADYDIWRMNLGRDLGDLSLLEGRAVGDLNGDRQIDLDDFGLIKDNRSPGAVIVVPEPLSSTSLLIAALLARVASRRRR